MTYWLPAKTKIVWALFICSELTKDWECHTKSFSALEFGWASAHQIHLLFKSLFESKLRWEGEHHAYIGMESFGFLVLVISFRGFPGGSVIKESAWQCRRCGSIPGLERVPGVGNFQHSCLENPTDRGACQAAVHGVAESWTRLNKHARISFRKLLCMGVGDDSDGNLLW